MTMVRLAVSLSCAALIVAALGLSEFATAQVLGPPPSSAPVVVPVGPIAPSTTPAVDWRAALAELKITPRGTLISKKHHMEVDATTQDGRRVIVSLDLAGRLWEIEDEYHDKSRYENSRPVDSSAAIQAAARAGFVEPVAVEVKKNHTVVRARNRKGEAVNLHVDRSGYIYKQIWVRSWQ